LLNERKLHTIRHTGKVVEGEILDSGKLEQSSGIKTHYLKVRFVQEDGNEVVKSFPVDEDDYLHALEMGRIPITYVPKNPGFSRVGKYYGYNRAPLCFAIIIFITSLSFLVVLEIPIRRKILLSRNPVEE